MLLDDLLENTEEEFNGPTILIDSDTICYRAAAATDGRQYAVGDVVFKYKEDAVSYCEEEGVDKENIELDYEPEPLTHALNTVKTIISNIQQTMTEKYGSQCHMEFFHSGKKNFRYDILENYKSNRVDSRVPEHLNECKEYVTKRNCTNLVEGFEADDLIGIRAYQLRARGEDYVIVTNDKDLKTIPGTNYNWVTGEFTEVSDLDAMKFLYAQIIAGDPTDNIPGVSGMGINTKGTGRAQKVISCLEIPDNFPLYEAEVMLYEAVLNVWLEGGPGSNGSYGCKSFTEVEEELKRTAQCVFILHKKDRLWKKPTSMENNYE